MNPENGKDVLDFEEFVKAHGNAIYNYLKKFTGSGMDAEDIFQEVLVKIAERLPDLREPEKIKTWAFRIATNAAVDFFRKGNKNTAVLDESIINNIGSEDNIEDQAVVEEMNDCIRREMGRIAPLYHTVLVLHYFEHMTIPEIARICDISEATVKIRLHRGKNLLHRILSEGCDFYYDKNSNMRCSSKSQGRRADGNPCASGNKHGE